MKVLIVILSMLSTAALAAGDLCLPLEYAEIKDTSTKSLNATFCKYQQFREIEQKLRVNIYDLEMKAIAQGNQGQFKRSIDDASARIEGCFDQQIKIERALKIRGAKSPTCPK